MTLVPRPPAAPPRSLSTVSIFVPCYNYGRYLRECVESVLGQEGVALRVLVIDDGSIDNSAAVAAELRARDPRVEVLRHATNRGHIRTYNEGLEWAAGDYTMLLDADDRLTPGALGRASAFLEAQSEAGFVYGRPLVIRGARLPRLPRARIRWRLWPGWDWIEQRCRIGANCVVQPTVVVRTDLLRRLGGFRAELPHSGDFEFWLRLAAHAAVGYIEGPYQAYYRDHADAMHRRLFGDPLADLAQVKAAFDALFRHHGADLRDRPRLEAMANRAVAGRALWAVCRALDGQRPAADLDGLVRLAVAAWPDASLLEWRGVRWRRRLGSRFCPYLWPFLLPTTPSRVGIAIRRSLERWRRLEA